MFHRWYCLYIDHGYDGMIGEKNTPRRLWNRIPDEEPRTQKQLPCQWEWVEGLSLSYWIYLSWYSDPALLRSPSSESPQICILGTAQREGWESQGYLQPRYGWDCEEEPWAPCWKWDTNHPTVSSSWWNNWVCLIPYVVYPNETRKFICTTSTIEAWSFEPILTKGDENRGAFPNYDTVLKILYLPLRNANKSQTMTIQH